MSRAKFFISTENSAETIFDIANWRAQIGVQSGTGNLTSDILEFVFLAFFHFTECLISRFGFGNQFLNWHSHGKTLPM